MAVRGLRPATLALALLAGCALVACTSSDDPPSSQAATGEAWRVPRIADRSVEGVATSFTEQTHRRGTDEPGRPPPGQVELSACRWRGPGLYTFDLTFRPDSGAQLPVTFPLSLDYLTGDMGSGRSGEIALARGGDFSVTINDNELRASWVDPLTSSSRWDSSGVGFSGASSVSCIARWDSGDTEVWSAGSDPVELAVDVYDDGHTLPDGSLEALARSADLAGPPSVAAAVRRLLAYEDLPELDRLYLALDAPLPSISVEARAGCIEVRSTYAFDDEWQQVVEVTQGLRCPEPVAWAARPVIGIVDDVWDVRVSGPREILDSFVSDHLVRFYLATVEPFEPETGAFDPHVAADEEIAASGMTELTRFDWNGGVVAVVVEGQSNWGPMYEPLIVLPGGPLIGGGGGMQCRTHTTLHRFDGLEGFALAVTERPGIRVVMQSDEMDQQDVPLEPIGGGREAGLVSLEGLTSTYSLTFTAFDADGVDLGCDQTPDPS